jgi:serine/threonine-protein kinase
VFSFALTLVELHVGHPVFDGDQAAMMGAALNEQRRPTPGNEGKPVSRALERVFEKALAVDPRRRYQDLGEFWDALLAAQSGLSEPTGGPLSSAPADPGTYNELDLGSSLPLATIELASEVPHAPARSALVEVPRAPRLPREHVVGGPRRPEPAALVSMSLPPLSLRPPMRFTVRDFAAPVAAICAGVGLSMLGEHYATTSGQVFSLGPLRLVWVTVPMVVLGSALVVVRLLQRRAHR